MKPANSTRSKAHIYSVGNYLMTGKVLGKGHFARVEEATHRIIGKKVAIKIIDLTQIKEEYARRNLHREPRVMAKLRHPCIAALYETMMHGPRLYVVMEVAGGGDLCTHVLSARGPMRGLPEARARLLASQLVSAVRHMHARGVVHRDLKMENIMLDSTKQFIKIVDFGLSNLWSAGGTLHTPCGSLEYAAPELFVDGRRYGPEVDLWSIGVIVYGMVTGGLPFTGAEGGAGGGGGGAGRSRPQLRAAIARGFTRKQRAALSCFSNECKTFIESLLEPNVDLRMKIEEAARHSWVRRPGLRMKTYPLGQLDSKATKEIYKQISDLCSLPMVDVVAQIKAEPFGATAGMFNIKSHLHQTYAAPGTDLLWSSITQESRPNTPPEYQAFDLAVRASTPSNNKATPIPNGVNRPQRKMVFTATARQKGVMKCNDDTNGQINRNLESQNSVSQILGSQSQSMPHPRTVPDKYSDRSFKTEIQKSRNQPIQQSPRIIVSRPLSASYSTGSTQGGTKKPLYKYDSGDCGLAPRLASIHEHSTADIHDKNKKGRIPFLRRMEQDVERRLSSCPSRSGDGRRADCLRRHTANPPNNITNWRAGMTTNTTARILLQSNATNIKRASLGSSQCTIVNECRKHNRNIVSPHSSTNSQCKSERAIPVVNWMSGRSSTGKDSSPLQRLRRTAPIK